MLAALAFIVLEIAAMGAWATVTKPFWLDEVATWLVAGTQSLPESIRALAAGVDSNPPTAHFLYRLAAFVAGGLSPITARVVTMACVGGALTPGSLLLR